MRIAMMIIPLLLLSACMYPSEERQQLGDVQTHIDRVQAQAEQYLAQNKHLPYKYTADEWKFISHYLIDFSLLSEIPPTAYEKGGNFYYVYVGAEGKDPLVRLFDLRVNDEVEKVQLAVNQYKSKHKSLPVKATQLNGYHDIDLEKLQMKNVQIPSPYYSDALLPILLDKEGRIYLDYRGDVTRLLQTVDKKPAVKEDLRLFLAKNSLFVPAFCPPLRLGEQGEILFSSETS